MNRELKRVSLVVMAMFLSLFVAASTIQVFNQESLSADPRNVRSVYDSYKTQRGAILVNGKPIALSTKSDDAFVYLREYSSPMYSSVTGFFSFFQGATGLESEMNSYLTGKNSQQFFEQINAVLSGTPVTGASVELTIDPKIQKVAWDALGNLEGAVVAVEPSTGRILALVSKPGFDANQLSVHDGTQANLNYTELLGAKGDPLVNKAISGDLYAPGSVFKLITSAAALESGDWTADSTLPNPVKYTLPGTNTQIQNSGEGKCGGKSTVSISDALRFSCNIPFAQLGIELGQDRIRTQAELFGFGKTVRTPLSATPSSFPENMDDAQVGLSSFGQFDVRVTPLQIVMVSMAIANKGVLMQPNLIENVLSPSLAVIDQPQPKVFAQPISESTATALKEMMVGAVSRGVSSNAQIRGVEVAGKTGTAQNGKDDPYTLWFTGFAPADNPQVAVAVVVANGGGQRQAGRGNTLAAPIARKVMEAVLNK